MTSLSSTVDSREEERWNKGNAENQNKANTFDPSPLPGVSCSRRRDTGTAAYMGAPWKWANVL
eukprot:scaffold323_cov232-Pinguiococcus_pyrenoidosus.AAC.14